jgi:F-type H+-transporting ATPase subunit delta
MGSASRVAMISVKAAVAKSNGLSIVAGAAILSVGRAIGSSPSLRAALANPVADAKAKAALIDSVVGAIDSSAKSLLHVVVGERWSSADEMLAGIEEIGVRVIASGSTDAIEAELFSIARIVAANPALELALSAKRGGAEAKRQLAGAVLRGASESTTEIVRHLVSQPRGRRIRTLLAEAQEIVADQQGRGVAIVTVSSPLDAAQRDRIAGVLRARFGREHHIDEIVDDTIVGGFAVQVGDDTIDASIRSRLTELSSKLAG